MGYTSKWHFGMQWRDVLWRWTVTTDNDDVSTKSITIFIIELGIWSYEQVAILGAIKGRFFSFETFIDSKVVVTLHSILRLVE